MRKHFARFMDAECIDMLVIHIADQFHDACVGVVNRAPQSVYAPWIFVVLVIQLYIRKQVHGFRFREDAAFRAQDCFDRFDAVLSVLFNLERADVLCQAEVRGILQLEAVVFKNRTGNGIG